MIHRHARSLRHALLSPLLAMLALAAVLIAQITYLMSVYGTVEHANAVLMPLARAERLLVDMEIGQRGYLLSGDDRLLAPYHAAAERIPEAFEALERSVRHDAVQEERVRGIRADHARWRENAGRERRLLRDRAAGDAARRRYRLLTDGQTLMDGMRSRFAALRAREEQTRSERIDQAQRTGVVTLVASGVALPLVGVLLALVTRRQMRGLSGQYEAVLDEEHAARERLATTLASIGDGVLVTDTDGRVVLMNGVGETLTGWTLAEARGRAHRDVFAIFHETTGEPVGSPADEALRTGATVLLANHTVLRRRDGTEIAIEDSAAPIRDEEGTLSGVVLVFRDVTGRRRANNELAASEQRFRAMADSMPHLVWVTNPDGYHIHYNRRWYEYTGLSEEASAGFGFANALHPDDVERTLARWRRAWEGGEGYEIEYRFRRHDGVYRWFVGRAEPVRDPEGEVAFWVGTCTDIDDQKRTADELRAAADALRASTEALRASEARHRFLFDTSPIGIVYQDANLRVFDTNRATEQISGLTRAQILGDEPPTPGWHAIHEDGSRLTPEQFPTRLALRTGETVRDYVMAFFRPETGRYHWVSVTAQPQFRDGEDRQNALPHMVYALMEEITERRESQAALAQYAREQARIAETLQRSLLLESPVFSYPGLDIASKYEPALDEALLGGDFFDVFALPDGTIALIVGDVTGKGLQAAARTAEVKFALRAFLHDTPDPAAALSRLNRFLVDMYSQGGGADGRGGTTFVSLNLALVDPRSGSVLCSAAGAEPVLVFRRGDASGRPEELLAGGVVLGADEAAAYESAATRLEPGDLLVIVTDGITEARRGRNDFFGTEGLARSVYDAVAAAREPLAGVSDAVLADARAFAGGTLRDDVCLLFARRTGGK